MTIEQSNKKPGSHRVERLENDMARVTMVDMETVSESIADGAEPQYQYVYYVICVPWREELSGAIAANEGAWLAQAKAVDYATASAEGREKRNALLAECDYTQMADYPIDDAGRDAWLCYRQALRDVTKHPDWPYLRDRDWPEAP